MKFLREFRNDDEWDYYGDLKATTIYLLFTVLQALFVVAIYAWMGKL